MKKKIIIIGAGFGGAYVAKHLAEKNDITLVDPEGSFTFMPLMHEAATGTLCQSDIHFPLSSFLPKRCQIIKDRAVKIDFENNTVYLESGSPLTYDICVIATGARTRSDMIPGSDKAIGLKSINDVIKIRERLKSLIKAGKPININVIGGGYTGLELVCELDELLNTHFNKYPRHLRIFNRSGYLLEKTDPVLSAYIARKLKRSAIDFEANCHITRLEDAAVITADKEWPSDITILAAGVMPNTEWLVGCRLDERKNLIVNRYLQLLDHQTVFALGDIITFEKGHKPPMLAQLATRQAKIVAKNINRLLRGQPLIIYKEKIIGVLVSLGNWDAAGRIFGMPIYGRLAWYIWRTVYLFKTPGIKNRLRIALRWSVYLFRERHFIERS